MFWTDVMIVGGAPAGASAALSLLTYTNRDLMLVDHSNLCQQRVGEHVSASIFSLLEYLKLEKQDFDPGCFMPAYGNVSYWGQDIPSNVHTISTPEGPTYQLDRESFDLKMIEVVAERGGLIFPRTRCTDFEQLEDNTWMVTLSHPKEGAYRVHARWLMDATGRQAGICKQVGAPAVKHDSLMGLGFFFRLGAGQEAPHEQMIEATPLGWWYAARLPGQMMTATFFTDADIIAERQLQKSGNWMDLLRESRHLKHKLNGSTLISKKPWVRNACSQITDATRVANFVAIGDAATSFDPISSLGIGSAMTSACYGARLAHAQLVGGASSDRGLFQKDLQANFARYLETRAVCYAAEGRWPSSPFWARRQNQTAACPVAVHSLGLSNLTTVGQNL